MLLIYLNRNHYISATSHLVHRGSGCAWYLTLEVATCGVMLQILCYAAPRPVMFAVFPVHMILDLRQHIDIFHLISTSRMLTGPALLETI